ncbi:MAG: ATP synthase F0 subunit B [Holdemanella sp.]|nr:ATP synthase F0 subunit B [Holdemanella sp.]
MPLNIDIQQILLHMFNFIILGGGLYILLYKPVKDFMDQREAYFRDLEAKSVESQAAAQETKDNYDAMIKDIQVQADEIKKKAIQEAEASAQATVSKAKEEADSILSAARLNANKEKQKALDEAKDDITNMAIEAVKKLMNEKQNPYDTFIDATKKGM